MKQLFMALTLVICNVFFSQTISSVDIVEKGKWGDSDIRSYVPAPPTASIEGKVLTIHFVDPLSNLTVCVTDNTGKIVYENCISASTPQSYPITLNVEGGEYTLNLVHHYGYVTGSFVVE